MAERAAVERWRSPASAGLAEPVAGQRSRTPAVVSAGDADPGRLRTTSVDRRAAVASAPQRGAGNRRTWRIVAGATQEAMHSSGPNPGRGEPKRSASAAHAGRSNLRVSRPGDRTEREADAVDGLIMRGVPSADVAGLRGSSAGSTTWPVSRTQEQQIRSALKGGKPLAAPTHAFFESRLGGICRACASTAVRTPIWLPGPWGLTRSRWAATSPSTSGAIGPGLPREKSLLAHELTHVVQPAEHGGVAGPVHRRTSDLGG